MRWFKRRVEEPKVFTGNCFVYIRDGDGRGVGRCYHSTYNNLCHVHGDVSLWLDKPSSQWPDELGDDLDLPCGCA
jgi:hypothetical protein